MITVKSLELVVYNYVNFIIKFMIKSYQYLIILKLNAYILMRLVPYFIS